MHRTAVSNSPANREEKHQNCTGNANTSEKFFWFGFCVFGTWSVRLFEHINIHMSVAKNISHSICRKRSPPARKEEDERNGENNKCNCGQWTPNSLVSLRFAFDAHNVVLRWRRIGRLDSTFHSSVCVWVRTEMVNLNYRRLHYYYWDVEMAVFAHHPPVRTNHSPTHLCSLNPFGHIGRQTHWYGLVCSRTVGQQDICANCAVFYWPDLVWFC